MILTVKPADLIPGDVLVLPDVPETVWVTEVFTDADGIWVAYSDGDEGYQSARVRVERNA